MHAILESERGVLTVGYTVLEYLISVGAALGLTGLVFVSSLLVILTHEGLAHVFRAARWAPRLSPQVSSTFGGRDLEGSRSPGIASAGGDLGMSQTRAAETLSDIAA
jgi:hypothetical protein